MLGELCLAPGFGFGLSAHHVIWRGNVTEPEDCGENAAHEARRDHEFLRKKGIKAQRMEQGVVE